MISPYLSKLGIREENLPSNWCRDDSRQKKWEEERALHGFDSRDTWALNKTLALMIYPRLKMYNDINIIDTSFHTFEYREETYTFQQCIDKILYGLELFLTKEDYDLTKEETEAISDGVILIGVVWGVLWW